MASLSIKLPEKLYIGFQSRKTSYKSDKHLTLGFMVPDGDDAQAKKRKRSVDRWSQSDIPAKSVDNELMAGFKIENLARQYGSTDWWRVSDPRGFYLEISSRNLSNILRDCVLENGEIQEQCVWGRDGATNILIPETSDVYKQAEENNARMSQKITLRDLKIGDHVLLQNGDKVRYYGPVYVEKQTYSWFSSEPEQSLGWHRLHAFEEHAYGDKYHMNFRKTAKMSSVIKHDPISDDDRIKYITSKVKGDNIGYHHRRQIKAVSLTKPKKTTNDQKS